MANVCIGIGIADAFLQAGPENAEAENRVAAKARRDISLPPLIHKARDKRVELAESSSSSSPARSPSIGVSIGRVSLLISAAIKAPFLAHLLWKATRGSSWVTLVWYSSSAVQLCTTSQRAAQRRQHKIITNHITRRRVLSMSLLKK